MKNVFLLPLAIFLSENAFARSLEDIKQSGTLKVALRERDLVYSKNTKLLQQIVAERFARELGVKAEFHVVREMSDFWQNSSGKVVQHIFPENLNAEMREVQF